MILILQSYRSEVAGTQTSLEIVKHMRRPMIGIVKVIERLLLRSTVYIFYLTGPDELGALTLIFFSPPCASFDDSMLSAHLPKFQAHPLMR